MEGQEGQEKGSEMMFVAVYVRVSTDDQNPENQVQELKAYCQRSEYSIHDIYIDKCSGRTEDRPEFQRILLDMRQRKFKAILVWKLDRIGRSLPHLLRLLQEMQNRKVEFICLTQNIDTTTASGRLIFQMMGIFAEFESTLVSERTRLGMARAKRQGIHCGRPRGSFKCKWPGCKRNAVGLTKEFCNRHKKGVSPNPEIPL